MFFRKNIAWVISLAILLLDQLLKIWVKTHMQLGESIPLAGSWFQLHFVENNGMAFGMELGGPYGKILLSVFRLIAISGIGYYLYRLQKRQATLGAQICLALIFSGALGNLLDCLFYGKIFGYETWFYGKVVDMLYFPLFEGVFPNWVPVWGGEPFLFFSSIFNLADTAISTGVFTLLVFQSRFFPPSTENLADNPTE